MGVLSPEEIVGLYFRCSEKYDLGLLRKIFDDNLKYIINDNLAYKNIGELTNYWIRNQKRQRNIVLEYKLIKRVGTLTFVDFLATFDDCLELAHNIIDGIILFEINEGKILRLSEWYNKGISELPQ